MCGDWGTRGLRGEGGGRPRALGPVPCGRELGRGWDATGLLPWEARVQRAHQAVPCGPASGPRRGRSGGGCWNGLRFYKDGHGSALGCLRTLPPSRACRCLAGGEAVVTVWREPSAKQPKRRDATKGGQLPDHGEPPVGQGDLHVQRGQLDRSVPGRRALGRLGAGTGHGPPCAAAAGTLGLTP